MARKIAQKSIHEKYAVAQRRNWRVDRSHQVRQGCRNPAAAFSYRQSSSMFCLKGKYEYINPGRGTDCLAASTAIRKVMCTVRPSRTKDTIVMEMYDGPHYPKKPSWYTDERDAH